MRRTIIQEEAHFLTLTVIEWVDVFTRRMYNDFLINCLMHCQQKKGLQIFAYVLMPNHLHLVVRAITGSLSDVLRDLKTYSAKELIKLIKDNPQESRKDWMLALFQKHAKHNPLNKHFQFWQNENYPVALANPVIFGQKVDYVHQNPVRAGFVDEPHHYVYSSANPMSPITLDES